MSVGPAVLMSASDTGIRGECHIDKSSLTFSNDGFHIMKGSQDVKADGPQRSVCSTLGLGGGDQRGVGQKDACKTRIQFCPSSHSACPASLKLPCESLRV